ncbi:amidohydrolase family protein [Sphingomonas bacterium]|uniref:amidohydrolase family protein n=1 Tax=Sphingomonas bacterium TaxID=1895847 RepID=UPI0015760127|nr:amidohydrolase family protein [Sphingomonas bacterium]
MFLLPAHGTAQLKKSPTGHDHGTFVLHKFARAIGKETWQIKPDAKGNTVLTSDFLFTDRGGKVPLKTTYVASAAHEPVSLKVAGKSSRLSELNDEFRLDGKRISLLRSGTTTTYLTKGPAFLIDGYSPVAMQGELMRWWLAHNKPALIETPPGGSIHIQPAGDLMAGGTTLHGYVVNGLIWGGETLWLDDDRQLAALVSTDAEFDHFEAIREDLEPSLGTFIQAAAKNSLAALAQLASSAQEPPAKRLAIVGVTLIDGTGAAAAPNSTVVIEDGRISSVYRGAMPKLKDVTVLDGHGKYLIPGLWDMHAHYEQVEWGPIYLAAGVTTARDCGNEFDFITTVRDTLASGNSIGPRLLIAGIVDGTGPRTLGAITADTPDEAVAVVRRYKAAGALQIKIYSSMKPALVPVITREAHRLSMTVTGHVPDGMTTVQAVEAGMDQINHINYPYADFLPKDLVRSAPVTDLDFQTPAVQHALAVFRQHATVFDPTMTVFEMQLHMSTMPIASVEPGMAHLPPQLAAALDTPGIPLSEATHLAKLYSTLTATLRTLHENGNPIVAGTDQSVPGYSLHRELEIYVEQAGFTPMQALQSATIVPARVMGLDKQLGTIEPGKQADMVLLNADPLADIHNTRRIAKTISAGAVYDPAPLWTVVGFKP